MGIFVEVTADINANVWSSRLVAFTSKSLARGIPLSTFFCPQRSMSDVKTINLFP